MDLLIFIQSFASPFWDKFFQLITMLGESYFIIPVVAFYYWCYDKKAGYRLALAYLSSGVINTALKEIFRVPRPIGKKGVRSLRLETAGGYSFPSGHSQMSATLFTSLLLEIRKRWFSILAIILMILVGVSRIYLGVHWPSDVIVGLILGASWVVVSNRFFSYLEKSGNKAGVLIFLIPALLGMVFFPTSTYYEAAGALSGLLLGYLLESKYLDYNVRASTAGQIIKFIIGLTGLLMIKAGVKVILPISIWSDFFRYLLLTIWLIVLAPLLFKKLKLFNKGNLS